MSGGRKAIRVDDNTYVEIVSERYNKLVRRVEVVGLVHHVGRGTPSRSELRDALSKWSGRPADNVYIRNIMTEYGVNRSLIRANIYDDGERAKAFEPQHVIRRHGS